MERAATAHSVPTLTIHDTTVPSIKVLARCGSCKNQSHLRRLHEDAHNSSATLQVYARRLQWSDQCSRLCASDLTESLCHPQM